MTLEGRLSRALHARAKRGPVTVDDARDALARLGIRNEEQTIRKVLNRPNWRPVGWRTTKKASRHGRPIRVWIPVQA